MTRPYRVFISYSHENIDIAREIEEALQVLGLKPMYDKDLQIGHHFEDQIKTFIAHAHVFLPIITKKASTRGWVHQEIGYALALNIPVLPVTVGMRPGEMLQTLQAVKLDNNPDKRRGEIERKLTLEVFENAVTPFQDRKYTLYRSAPLTEDRAVMLAQYCEEVLDLQEYGLVRQIGGLSSLHIPQEHIDNSVWQERIGPKEPNEYHNRCLRDERIALEQHVRNCGCKLIIDPTLDYKTYGPHARVVRLKTLVDFLKGVKKVMKEDPRVDVQIIFKKGMAMGKSVTIVGDWFVAESVKPISGKGYHQTIFTRHAPSMQRRIQDFDQEFDEGFNVGELKWREIFSAPYYKEIPSDPPFEDYYDMLEKEDEWKRLTAEVPKDEKEKDEWLRKNSARSARIALETLIKLIEIKEPAE